MIYTSYQFHSTFAVFYPGFWFIHITIVNTSGHSNRIINIIEYDPTIDVPDDAVTRPLAFRLNQCMPNPFHMATEVSYAVPTQAHVALTIHDIGGRMVRTLVDREIEPGSHRVLWDGRDSQGRRVSSGIYYVKMKSSEFERTRKITVLR